MAVDEFEGCGKSERKMSEEGGWADMRTDSRRAFALCAAFAVAAFAFNTSELAPAGLLGVLPARLGVSATAVGLLTAGYGLTVAAVSLPLACWTGRAPRRPLLTAVFAVLGTAGLVSAAATSYGLLLAARVAGALAQAVFWAVMPPTAAGLFPPERSGRVLALISSGGSLALVAGVPAAVWLGRAAGPWAPFLALGLLSLIPLAVVGTLLPTAARGTARTSASDRAPNARGFAVTLAVSSLTSAALSAGYTYIVTFLTKVSGFAPSAVTGPLAAFGVAGALGVAGVGLLLDRNEGTATLVPVLLQGLALAGLFLYGTSRLAAFSLLTLLGISSTPIYAVTQTRALRTAPGRAEIAMSANSTAWNGGVASGALLGGLATAAAGVRTAFLDGALLTLGAAAVLLGEALLAPATSHPATPQEEP